MNTLKCLMVGTILISFFACNKGGDFMTTDSETEPRDGITVESVSFVMMGGIDGASETGNGDCTTGGSCALGGDNVVVTGIEEELIIEAIAQDLCLTKFSLLSNRTIRVDLIASPDTHERDMRDINAPRNQFIVGDDGDFAAATKSLGLGNGGCKKGIYKIYNQSTNRYWSGYLIFNSGDLL